MASRCWFPRSRQSFTRPVRSAVFSRMFLSQPGCRMRRLCREDLTQMPSKRPPADEQDTTFPLESPSIVVARPPRPVEIRQWPPVDRNAVAPETRLLHPLPPSRRRRARSPARFRASLVSRSPLREIGYLAAAQRPLSPLDEVSHAPGRSRERSAGAWFRARFRVEGSFLGCHRQRFA